MKKITLLIALIAFAFNAKSQTDCSSAQAISDGTYTVASVDGTAPTTNCAEYPPNLPPNAGVWYEYTNNGNQDLLVTVSSDLQANAGVDTKLSILTGSCGNLVCVANNDDVFFGGQGDPNNNILSETEFVAEIGETYYIVFDATWDPSGFDFVVSSSTNIPGAPNAATTPMPTDGATDVAVEETTDDNGDPIQQTPIQWAAPTAGPAPTGYEIYFGTDQNSLNFLGTAAADAAGSPIDITGIQYDTTYYWEIVPLNNPVSATGTQVWSFTTEENLSSEQFEFVNFDFYVNNGQLSLNADQSFHQINIYDLSGKKVMTQELSSNDENVSIQSLAKGLYLAKVQIGDQTKTFKFIK
jgi:hypothetical protein